jgi:hypothetical protein
VIGPEALDAIRQVARQLGELREQVVFIGGAVRGLLITDEAVQGSRATKDVDVITAGIDSRAAYYARIHGRLRTLGFVEDASEGAPLCRWRLGAVVVDAMPPVADVLGFTNRWYLHAVATANTVRLPDDGVGPVEIRLISAPSFLATKLEAFAGRGEGDYLASHDIEGHPRRRRRPPLDRRGGRGRVRRTAPVRRRAADEASRGRARGRRAGAPGPRSRESGALPVRNVLARPASSPSQVLRPGRGRGLASGWRAGRDRRRAPRPLAL